MLTSQEKLLQELYVNQIKIMLLSISDEDRLDITKYINANFCGGCGRYDANNRCRCWDDE